jgi:hypothetical protein
VRLSLLTKITKVQLSLILSHFSPNPVLLLRRAMTLGT